MVSRIGIENRLIPSCGYKIQLIIVYIDSETLEFNKIIQFEIGFRNKKGSEKCFIDYYKIVINLSNLKKGELLLATKNIINSLFTKQYHTTTYKNVPANCM